jgi:hypothetical protein
VSGGASGQNDAMGEHDESEPEEPEEPEAAVLPAREAMSIITSGGEPAETEEPARDDAS